VCVCVCVKREREIVCVCAPLSSALYSGCAWWAGVCVECAFVGVCVEEREREKECVSVPLSSLLYSGCAQVLYILGAHGGQVCCVFVCVCVCERERERERERVRACHCQVRLHDVSGCAWWAGVCESLCERDRERERIESVCVNATIKCVYTTTLGVHGWQVCACGCMGGSLRVREIRSHQIRLD